MKIDTLGQLPRLEISAAAWRVAEGIARQEVSGGPKCGENTPRSLWHQDHFSDVRDLFLGTPLSGNDPFPVPLVGHNQKVKEPLS